MAVFLLSLFLFSFHQVQAQAQARTNHSDITIGSSLSPTSNPYWLSPSGRYAFGFYNESDGFAVGVFLAGIPEKTLVWIANWDQTSHFQPDRIVPSNAKLLLTSEGGLILQAEDNEIKIADPDETIASASMLDNGNFVLYNYNQGIEWQTFDHPADTLLPGQHLSAGQQLSSRASETDYSIGKFFLLLKSSGDLGQWPVKYDAELEKYQYYSTGTSNAGDGVTLNLDDDGHLYLLKSTEIIKNITPGGYPRQQNRYLMRLDVDGIFRVYSVSLDNSNLTAVWWSTNDKCAPKGRCGVNRFCVPTDQDILCHCLPGFEFISGNQNSGCKRNFTAVSCNAINQRAAYTMRKSNTIWVNSSYAELRASSVEDCEQKCMEDCNCEAALFMDKLCKKQKLPLRFGRIDTQDHNISLIKVGTTASITNEFTPTVKIEKIKEQRRDVLIVGISLIAVAILVLAIGVLRARYHTRTYEKIIKHTQNVDIIDDITLRAFSYNQLVQITNDFTEELGKGGSGTVYKGVLSHCQTVVAVKKLETELAQGEKEFQTELKVIAKTHHRNLVCLLGYCIDGSNRLLVYEFMDNGSLADILFSSTDRLSWTERVGIATDIVKGIIYLHEECKTPIIHCDIKPQNILMDENMCAKISDFGVAKLLKQDQSRIYTGARGTKGYVAPEWFRKLPVTVKADVHSFGIMLLEIICHRKNVDWSLPENEAVLDEWVYSCFMAGELSKLVPDEEVDMKMLERWVKVGIWCIQNDPSLRPSMKTVQLMLEGIVQVPIPPTPSCLTTL